MRIREVYAAGVPKQFTVPGNFLRVRAATGATLGSVDVRFWKNGSLLPIDLIACDPGDWAKFPAGFDQFEITSSVNQTIDVYYARGDVGSNNVVGIVSVAGTVAISGIVSVVDGNKARTLAGQSFFGAIAISANAANFAHAQLFVPLAASVRAILEQIRISTLTGSPNTILIREYSTGALPTAIGNGRNKDFGQPSSVAELNVFDNPTVGFGPAAPFMAVECIPPQTSSPPYLFHEPVVLRPGKGIMISNVGMNQSLYASFEWTEEPNV